MRVVLVLLGSPRSSTASSTRGALTSRLTIYGQHGRTKVASFMRNRLRRPKYFTVSGLAPITVQNRSKRSAAPCGIVAISEGGGAKRRGPSACAWPFVCIEGFLCSTGWRVWLLWLWCPFWLMDLTIALVDSGIVSSKTEPSCKASSS